MAYGAASFSPLAVFCAVTLSAGVVMIPFHNVFPLLKKDAWASLISQGSSCLMIDMRSLNGSSSF